MENQKPVYHNGVDLLGVEGADLTTKSHKWLFNELGEPEDDSKQLDEIRDLMEQHGSKIKEINAKLDFRSNS